GIGEEVAVEGARFALTPAAEGHRRIALSVARFPDAVRDLQRELAVSRPEREAAVVVVRYRGSDPGLVQAVPNALAAHFLERRQRVQSADARGTVAFLEEQLDTLERQLSGAEEALRAFREEHAIVSLEAEAGAQVERLAETQARRDLLEADRLALGQLLAEAAAETAEPDAPSPYRKLMAFPSLIQSGATTELLGQLAGLENTRAE